MTYNKKQNIFQPMQANPDSHSNQRTHTKSDRSPAVDAHAKTQTDYFITWTFAAILVVPGSGELTLLLSMLVGLFICMKDPHCTRQSIQFHSLWLPALALASLPLLKGLSWIWSVDPERTLKDTALHLHFLMWLPLVLLYRQAHNPLQAMLLGTRIAAVLLLLWATVNWHQHGLTYSIEGRLEAGAQNPGVFGQLVGVMALWWALACFRMPSWHSLATALALLAAVYAAGGRSHIVVAWAGAAALMALYVVLKMRNRWLKVLSVSTLLCAAALVAHGMWPNLKQAQQEVEAYQHNAVDSSTALSDSDAAAAVGTSVGNRAGLFHVALQAFPDAPWLGFGAGTSAKVVALYSPMAQHFAVTRHYHQQYVQILMDTGMVGFAMAAGALIALSLWLRAHSSQNRLLWGCYLALLYSTAAIGLLTGALQQGLVHAFLVMALAVMGAQACQANSKPITALTPT